MNNDTSTSTQWFDTMNASDRDLDSIRSRVQRLANAAAVVGLGMGDDLDEIANDLDAAREKIRQATHRKIDGDYDLAQRGAASTLNTILSLNP